MGTREQVPQSNLSNKEGRGKKLMETRARTKWKHIIKKHRYGHDGFKSPAMKDTMNLQKCLSY